MTEQDKKRLEEIRKIYYPISDETDLGFLLRLLDEERERVQEVWDKTEQDISGRLFDHPIYSLTDILHGLRQNFNDILGVNEELENAFQNGTEYETSIKVISLNSEDLQ